MPGGFSPFTTISVDRVLSDQGVDALIGLTPALLQERQQKFGRNQLAAIEVRPWYIFVRQFKSAFVYLLLMAGLIAWMLGERIDGIIIYLFVLVNAVISFFQEYRSEQTVKLLQKFVQAKARVRRAGEEVLMDQTELVPGDIVLVEAGDMIPADIRFIAASNLVVNETVLTGESIAVAKSIELMKKEATEIYQALNIGFSGTTVVEGSGEGVVFATGASTVLGGIATLTTQTKRISGFSKEIDKFSGFVLKVILLTLLLLFAGNLFVKGSTVNIGELLIFSIALAVSVVPEALPVVTTFSLSHGALRLAKKKVVVKRLSAIEDLGSIEVLCTDKTGTLTENVLEVSEIIGPGKDEVIFCGAVASGFSKKSRARSADPFDIAIMAKLENGDQRKIEAARVINEIPFDPRRCCNSVLVAFGTKHALIVRGAPEVIMAASKNVSKKESTILLEWIAEQGSKGRRVLAVARKDWGSKAAYTEKDEAQGLEFLGVISFVDPIKPSTKAAIKKAKHLGLSIKIITGDSREVAGVVAYEVGLIQDPKQVITGEEFGALSAEKRHQAAEDFHVFARVSPQQKYEIIQLLEEKHQVGFLGEGINDAPALKIANVAIVVESASDIAREAADIVLLKKSLSVIVDGVTEGRIVFANTLKYIKATLASNFGNFYAVAAATFFIDYLPMLPLQILLLNLLTDFPMISIATDTTDPGELQRPEKFHIKEIALFMTIIGVVSTVFDLIFFAVFRPMGPSGLQTAWFIGSVLTELAFLFSIRSKLPFFKASRPAPILFILSGIAAVVALVLPFTNVGVGVFKFTAPSSSTLLTIFAIVAVYFVTTESAKLFYYRWVDRTAR